MIVYAFMYNDDINKSGWIVLSLHKTKPGAYKAMRDFIKEKHIHWCELRNKYGKQLIQRNKNEGWYIKPMQVLP